jgi:archaellum component FlaF (FlaF/FlaG flagellin family)
MTTFTPLETVTVAADTSEQEVNIAAAGNQYYFSNVSSHNVVINGGMVLPNDTTIILTLSPGTKPVVSTLSGNGDVYVTSGWVK